MSFSNVGTLGPHGPAIRIIRRFAVQGEQCDHTTIIAVCVVLADWQEPKMRHRLRMPGHRKGDRIRIDERDFVPVTA